MGLPVAATRASGLDAVVENVTGLLAPAGESEALADILIQLMENPDLRTRLGRAAGERVPCLFADERVNHLWISEYRRALCESFPGFPNATPAKI